MSSAGDIRVLHVDDESAFTDVAAMHLERVDEGITVTAESSARDGLERLRTSTFDCVVSDHDMPGMNGLEFLKAVREEFPELPFILFTGKGNEEIASDAISAGVTEYLQKDVGTDQYAVLANRIERAVGEYRAKAALEESERQLSTLISNLPGMVYRARNESDWPMEFVSDGIEELVGYEADTIESGAVPWGSLIYEEDKASVNEAAREAIEAEEPFEVTYRIETASGETRWMWERGRAVGTTDDGVELLEGFVTDITAREERARQLEHERQLSQKLVDTLDDVFYVLGPKGELLRWNDSLVEVSGYSDAELSEMTAYDLVPDRFHERVDASIETAIEAGQGTVEVPIETKAGRLRRYEFHGAIVERWEDDLLGLVGVARDVTARQDHEEMLERYRTLVENVGDPMYVLDPDGTVRMVNDAMANHLGYDRDDIVGSHAERFIPEDDFERATDALMELVHTGEKQWATVEMRTIGVEGSRTVTENKMAPLFDEDDAFGGSVGVMRDVTARKQREWELGRYQTIVEAVGDPVYALDEDGVFTFVNEAIEPMTGYSPSELVGEHIGTIMTDEDVDRGDELIQTLLTDPATDAATMEMDVVTKSGERIPSENNLALLPTQDGAFTGTAGIIRDIHERTEREERLDEFASVVSHDLRNPLNVVQGRLELAQETGEVTHLDAATDAAARMEQLIDDLLTLARQGDAVGTFDRVDLETAAKQAWTNVDTVDVTLELAGTATFEADPERFRELLENLFRNSVEHGRHGGSEDPLAQAARRQPAERDREPLTVSVGTLNDGGGFYVADDGQGIPVSEREAVFERGYTTAAGGTGFGLAIVEDIASAHDWTVSVTDSESGGARFEFRTIPVDR
jgi:PAS domain S-box-containing protein